MTQIDLPFKVDQIVEVKSFISGYRGAWFRCKILEIFTRRGELHYKLEYLDYEEEMIHVTKIYQKFRGEVHLMVRPKYPPHYHEKELLKINNDREPLLVIHDSWKVGDSVDWLKDACFWSGTILELKENGAVQIGLIPLPVGQGGDYEASGDDLRPMLDWTPDGGWKLPSMDGQKRQCARLAERRNEEQTQTQTQRATQQGNERATKKMKGDDGLPLNIMESDSIEAAVYDLEEIVVRLKWLESLLKPDGGESSKTYWKYEEYRPSAKGN